MTAPTVVPYILSTEQGRVGNQTGSATTALKLAAFSNQLFFLAGITGRHATGLTLTDLLSARAIPAGVEYHRVLAGQNRQIGRGILALFLLMAGLFVSAFVIQKIGAQVDSALGREAFANDKRIFTPVGHAFSLLSVALLAPWSMVLQRWLYGVPASSLHSVVSKFRWDYFGRALVIMLPLWVLFFTLPYIAGDAGAKLASWTIVDLITMLAVVILLTPLQATAEEYSTRGLAFRVGASWAHGPRTSLILGIAVSSVIFASGHLSTDPWLISYYLMFGVGAATIVWRTGGLETTSVLHSVYNSITFLISIVLHRDVANQFDRQAGSASPAVLILGFMVLMVAGGYWLVTRRAGPPRTQQLKLQDQLRERRFKAQGGNA